MPQLAGLHPRPFEVLVDVVAAEANYAAPPGPVGGSFDLRVQLTSVNEGIDAVRLEAE